MENFIDNLTKKDIVEFIENYGEDDVYYSHKRIEGNRIQIDYIPCASKMLSVEAIDLFKDDLSKNYNRYKDFLRTIIITDKKAKIVNAPNYAYKTLEENYNLFQKDFEIEHANTNKTTKNDNTLEK